MSLLQPLQAEITDGGKNGQVEQHGQQGKGAGQQHSQAVVFHHGHPDHKYDHGRRRVGQGNGQDHERGHDDDQDSGKELSSPGQHKFPAGLYEVFHPSEKSCRRADQFISDLSSDPFLRGPFRQPGGLTSGHELQGEDCNNYPEWGAVAGGRDGQGAGQGKDNEKESESAIPQGLE